MSTERNTRLYFLAHGLEIDDPKALEAAVRQAVQRLSGIQALSKGEATLLRKSGLNPAIESGADPLAETSAAFAALLRDCLDTAEAAARLGIPIRRLRQMLTSEATLYGFRINGRWQVPRYQFMEQAGLIPGIDQVNRVLDRALHPVAVYRWLTRPDPDLEVEGAVLSPLAWLKTGRSAEAVRRIAAAL